MRLLLTRALADAARTRAKLEALGHEVLVAPVLDIMALPISWPEGAIDAVVATSGHAFTALLKARCPAPEARRLIPLYLVGTRTAAQACDAGFRGAATVAADAARLAPRLADLAGKRVVYLAGRDRKPEVEDALKAGGSAPDLLESYEARATEAFPADIRSALATQAIDAVLHFSPRSAERFVTLAGGMPAMNVQHFCLSREVANPLRAAGFASIEIAETPDENALLALVGRPQA